MTKEMIGKLITIKYRERQNLISGILIDFNEQYTLLSYNPVDFILDGYILLNTKNVLKYKYGEDEQFKYNIISNTYNMTDMYPIDIKENTSNVISLLYNRYRYLGIELKDESVMMIGEIISNDKSILCLKLINPQGVIDKHTTRINIKKIRIIYFDTHYINSLYKYVLKYANITNHYEQG